MLLKPIVVLSIVATLGLAASPAAAQASKKKEPAAKAKKAEPAKGRASDAAKAAAPAGTFLIATYGDWGAYTSGKDKTKVCYALSQPKDRLPKGLTRDPAYVFISNRPGDGARNEFSVIMGFPLKTGGPASVGIGNASYVMLTKDKSGWLKNPAEEAPLIEAMKKASAMTIKATSGKGNETTDRYSLSGLNQALDRAQKECP